MGTSSVVPSSDGLPPSDPACSECNTSSFWMVRTQLADLAATMHRTFPPFRE